VELRLDALADLVGGELLGGRPDAVISGVGSLEEAGPTEASFLGNAKYKSDFLATRAGVVLIPPDAPAGPDRVPLVRVESPTLAFSTVIAQFAEEFRVFEPGVHPGASLAEDVRFNPSKVSVRAGAVVEAGSVIGDGTEIGPGVVVERGVRIGEDCLLHANATVRERCVLGNRVVLQPGAVIGSDGYGYELVEGRHQKIPQVGIVVIEDDVEIGANSTIDRARFGRTVIGEGTKIDNLVQVGHNVVIGKHCLLVAKVGIAGSTKLGNYVTMAARSGTTGHIELADHVVVAGMSGVAKSLPEPGVYMGKPARPIKDEMRSMAALARLPQILKDFKALQREVEELKKRGEES
jgi:UDP-3-O-[3-hydroxymyristoyl] glucosamine N-acyltransferase